MAKPKADEKKLIEKPEFLSLAETADDNIEGMELLKDYRQLNFFKIIQGSSKLPFKPLFTDGDVITVPGMQKVISHDEHFMFIPVFSYPEFVLRNPYGVKPFIREKSLDPNSEIAAKCKSRDSNIREFACPEAAPNAKDKMCKYTEHLNFVIVLDDHNEEIGQEPIVMTFSVGEYTRGMNFISLIRNRAFKYGGKKHMCINRFQASVSIHQKNENSWWGFDILNPEDPEELPYVDEEDKLVRLIAMSEAIKSTFQEGGIEVDYDAGGGGETVDGVVVTPEEEAKF